MFETIRRDFDKVLLEIRRGLQSYTPAEDVQEFISYFKNIIHHVEFINKFMYLDSIELLKSNSLIASDSKKGIEIIDKLVSSYNSLIPDILILKSMKKDLKPLIFQQQKFPVPKQYPPPPPPPSVPLTDLQLVAPELPIGWEKRVDQRTEQVYYWNSSMQTKQWEHPLQQEKLPPDWNEYYDSNKNIFYYFNDKKKLQQFDRPQN